MEKLPNKLARRILRTLVFALIGVILGLGVYNINAKLLVGDQMPMPLGFATSVVLTGSMEPELSANDLLIIRKTDTLYEGQVIVFQSGKSLTVHRILEINGEELVTKGDANNTPDDPITRDMVKGEVVLAIPFAGGPVRLLKNPFVILCLLGVAIWLLERSFHREKAAEQGELDRLKQEIEELKK